MIHWQLQLMWPLLVALLALAAFALYVFAHSDRQYRLKLLLIPALMGAMTFSFPWLASRMGYAYPEGLPQSFEYIAHKLMLENDRKAWIDILVVSRKPLERDARLHRVPWSKPLEEALKKAMHMQQGGGRVEIDRRGDADAYPFVPRRVLPQDVLPKSPLPDQPDLLAPQGPSV